MSFHCLKPCPGFFPVIEATEAVCFLISKKMHILLDSSPHFPSFLLENESFFSMNSSLDNNILLQAWRTIFLG